MDKMLLCPIPMTCEYTELTSTTVFDDIILCGMLDPAGPFSPPHINRGPETTSSVVINSVHPNRV